MANDFKKDKEVIRRLIKKLDLKAVNTKHYKGCREPKRVIGIIGLD